MKVLLKECFVVFGVVINFFLEKPQLCTIMKEVLLTRVVIFGGTLLRILLYSCACNSVCDLQYVSYPIWTWKVCVEDN